MSQILTIAGRHSNQGLGTAAASVSRPDLLAQAVSVARAAGIELTCKEEAVWFPDMMGGQQFYLNRVCAAPGTGFNFSADAIASGLMTDVLRQDIARARASEPVQPVQISPALNFQQPAGFRDPVVTATATPAAPPRPQTTGPGARSSTYQSTIYKAPLKPDAPPPPAGQAPPPAGPSRSKDVIQKQAGGQAPPNDVIHEQAGGSRGGGAPLSTRTTVDKVQDLIADSGIPGWAWIAAAVGIAFLAAKGQK